MHLVSIDSCYSVKPKTMVCWWWIRWASILRMMFEPYLAAGQTLAFSEEKLSNAQLGTWGVCGWTGKMHHKLRESPSFFGYRHSWLPHFDGYGREVLYPSEVCHDDERFGHCTSKWTRHIWVRQCGVHGLQRGAGRQMTKECGGHNCTKYFLVKWYWSEIIKSWFGWMDATSISAGSVASCLLFWFYILLFWLTGNSSSKMEHAEIKWICF